MTSSSWLRVLRPLTVVVLLGAASGAMAQSDNNAATSDKYDFFSQPTATREQVVADLDECRDLSSAVKPPPAGYVYSPNVAAAGVNGFMQGLMKGAQRRHMFDAALRRCMNVKGYARYATSKSEAELLYSGDWADMRQKLADRALAPVGDARRLDP